MGIAFGEPSPEEVALVLTYLRALDAAGGFVADGELGDVRTVALAERLGYISQGGGWGVGVRLTAKGAKAIA